MGGFANILGSVLYGKRSGGVVKPNPRTPGTFNGKLYQPPPDPGNPIALGPDSGYTPEQADLRATIARPPQEGVKPDGTKIGGLRRVLGTIASSVGPLIGGPAVAGIGEKLLHPGLDKWNSDVVRKQALAQMSVDARNHQDLQANRKLQEDQRRDMQTDREQGAVDRVEKVGWQVPMPTAQSSLSTRLYQPPQPQQPTAPQGPPTVDDLKNQDLASLPTNRTSVQQTLPNVEDQVDARTGKRVGDAGDVEWLNKPGTQGKQNSPFLRPSARTQSDMATEAARRKKVEELNAARTEEITPEMLDAARALRMTGLPSAGMVTPAVYNNFQTSMREFGMQNNKPMPSPTSEGEKIKYQNITAKLAAEGLISGGEITDSRKMLTAIQKSKTLTPEEKNGAIAYMASNNTPAATGANTIVKVEGYGNIREMPVIDTQNGTLQYLNANDINQANRDQPGRYVPSGPGQKAMTQGAVFSDLHFNINTARNAINALESMDAGTRAKLSYALRHTDPKSSIDTFLAGAVGTTLTPEQQEAVQSLALLSENAMSLRGVAGMGQGSDELRAAIQATLPSGKSPSKGYALGQLNKFEEVVKRLESGVVKVPLRKIDGPQTGVPRQPAIDPHLKAYADQYFGGNLTKAQAAIEAQQSKR